MNFISIGDMARNFKMRHQSGAMKQQLDRLTQELTTGRKADWAAEMRGDYSTVARIEGSLAVLGSYKTAATEAQLMAQTMQGALQTINDMVGDAGPSLLSFSTMATPDALDAKSADARQKFLSTVNALNVNTGGRYVMAGAATDTPPLISGTAMLAAIKTAVASELTASDVASAVSAWFDAPPGGGGFLDVAYQGSPDKLGEIPVSERDSANLGISAADPEIRAALKGLALAALAAEGVMGQSHQERSHLVRLAGEQVMASGSGIVGVQAKLGIQEEAIAQSQSRNASEQAMLSIAKSELAQADPYETATAIEAVRAQIETLYTITSRLSRLNLVNFLS